MGDGEEVKLYGAWYSPASLRVEMALKLKGIPYEYLEEDLTNKSPALLNYNPIHKKVPVLVHKGKAMAESMIIIEYIDETWNHANPILPFEPFDRAMARFWADFLSEKCGIPIWRACWNEDEKGIEEAHRTLKTLDEQMALDKAGKFFAAGDGGGFVEMAANTLTHWIDVVQEVVGVELITEDKYPTIWEWSKEYKTRALVKEFLPPRDALLAHYKARFQTYKASRS